MPVDLALQGFLGLEKQAQTGTDGSDLFETAFVGLPVCFALAAGDAVGELGLAGQILRLGLTDGQDHFMVLLSDVEFLGELLHVLLERTRHIHCLPAKFAAVGHDRPVVVGEGLGLRGVVGHIGKARLKVGCEVERVRHEVAADVVGAGRGAREEGSDEGVEGEEAEDCGRPAQHVRKNAHNYLL